jgi:hypothetical protein
MKQLHPDLLAQFYRRFPHTQSLRIVPVTHEHGYHEGFDIEDVEGLLGPARFAKLMQTVKVDFVCAHRVYPAGHPQAGCEVHCIYAVDLEKFLEGGN